MESAVYLGLDTGKSIHYALVADASGKPIHQTAVPHDETALRKLVIWAREQRSTMVVGQPRWSSGIAAEPVLASEVRIATCSGWTIVGDGHSARAGTLSAISDRDGGEPTGGRSRRRPRRATPMPHRSEGRRAAVQPAARPSSSQLEPKGPGYQSG
jgi:hypothetical protein